MEREDIRKILDILKSKAPEGVPIHQRYGWGGFLDVLEQKIVKK